MKNEYMIVLAQQNIGQPPMYSFYFLKMKEWSKTSGYYEDSKRIIC